MEKNRLVDFVAKIMEDSGFKVQKYFKTSKHLVDIYGVLPTVLGDMSVVVACKNYEERWKVGLDVIKEMEMVAKTLKASKVVIVTTSTFSPNATSYAKGRNVKLIDKDGLMNIAKSFSNKNIESYDDSDEEMEDIEEYTPSFGSNAGGSFLSSGRKGSLSGRGRKGSSSVDKLKVWAKVILSSTAGLILIVLAISALLTYLVSPSRALLGVLRILFAAILSYGIVMAVERDLTVTLIKGSTVFFVSLLIYVAIIIFT